MDLATYPELFPLWNRLATMFNETKVILLTNIRGVVGQRMHHL